MLYTINYASIGSDNLDSMSRVCPKNSPILFYEDGVLACKANTVMAGKMKALLAEHPVYALIEDVKARGIEPLVEGVKTIDYGGFVELVESHDVVPWLRN
ncbi:MAG: sulfurtransferase complex subunit TusB [Chloroflexi bacterium]|nr:sulfurtransferase complex subunit TusB [Chloroflexota bacterium]